MVAEEVERVRILVDREACESHAVCVAMLPDIFGMDDDDVMRVLIERPSPSLLPELRNAVDRCPRAALRLELLGETGDFGPGE